MTKLRLSAHPLLIENGRYHRPPIPAEERLCQYCNFGEIEDEKHFVLNCSLYSDPRDRLMSTLSEIFPDLAQLSSKDLFKFMFSLGDCDTEVMGPVLKFITECFDKRAEVGAA